MNNNQNSACAVGPVGCAVHEGAVPENVGRTTLTTVRNGRFTPEQLAKAKAFWQRKQALRKLPGNCGRCGHPNDNPEYAHCERCREYGKRYKTSHQHETITVDRKALETLEKRVSSLEHALSRIQLNQREAYKRGYAKGRAEKARLRRRFRYFDAYPSITKQELSTINHAYA